MISTLDVAVHPFASVPVTRYVIELAGVAVTGDPVAALNVPDGLQLYVEAPPAVRVTVLPK